jgi:hypothetical protein
VQNIAILKSLIIKSNQEKRRRTMCEISCIRRLCKQRLWLFVIPLSVVGVFSLSSCGSPKGKCTGPLDIHRPIYAGAKIVACEHGTAGCPIFVYASQQLGQPGQLVGQGTVSPVGQGEVYLIRALKEGEFLSAKQDPAGYPTWPQKSPTVEKVPFNLLINGEKFKSPMIVPPVKACQGGVRVEGLVEGVCARVKGGLVFPPAIAADGSDWTPYKSTFVGIAGGLREGDELKTNQSMDEPYPTPSDYSQPPVRVEELPESLPMPRIVEDVGNDGILDVLVGTEILNVDNLHIGAEVTIYAVDQQNKEHPVGGGIASAKCCWGHVEPLKKNLKYCVRQSLCTLVSPDNPNCAFPHDSINTPSIREPLCDGDIDVIVDMTAFGSTVRIRVNGQDKGNATAFGSSTLINVDGGVPLKEGDKVTVKQDNTSLDSSWSHVVSVKSQSECEAIESPDLEPPPDPINPVCKPGKDKVTLIKRIDICPSGGIQAYKGMIPPIKGAKLFKITNNTAKWHIYIVEEHNEKGQMGTMACEDYGGLCYLPNVKILADLYSSDSWSNIPNPDLNYGPFRLYVCVEQVGGNAFPSSIDLEYEWICP